MSILYCDFQYVKTGHHDQDFLMMNKYCNGKLTHIKYNEKELFKNISVISKILKRKEPKTIATVSFLALFLSSIITNKWNYNIIVHFIPRVHFIMHKFILSIILKKCNKVFVFADCVKDDIEKTLGKSYVLKIFLLHTREIIFKTKCNSNRNTILCIGNLNSMKNIENLLLVIQENRFGNINFKFICKGISDRISKISFSNKFKNSITIEDRFPSLEEYKNELYAATFTYLDYTVDYGIRCSAVMLDSLAQGTPVITNDNLSFTSFIKKYKCGYVFKNIDELKILLKKIDSSDIPILPPSKKLMDDYSEKNNKLLAKELLECEK